MKFIVLVIVFTKFLLNQNSKKINKSNWFLLCLNDNFGNLLTYLTMLFEILTDGNSFIVVADTGNNDHDKDPLTILRFKEPEVKGQDMTISSNEIEKLEVRYEDYR